MNSDKYLAKARTFLLFLSDEYNIMTNQPI